VVTLRDDQKSFPVWIRYLLKFLEMIFLRRKQSLSHSFQRLRKVMSGPHRKFLIEPLAKKLDNQSYCCGYQCCEILVIGLYSLYLSDKTDRLEEQNEKLKTEIQLMTR
jgi:hypothetical protein